MYYGCIGNPSAFNQCDQFGPHNVCCFPRTMSSKFNLPHLPIHTLDLVHQDHTTDSATCGQFNFKGIALRAACNRASQGESGSAVILGGAQDDGGTAPGLFSSGLRVESQPDQIAAVRPIVGAHQISLPSGFPQSIARCRFFGVMPATSSDNL